MRTARASKRALQKLLDGERFVRPWKFRVVSVGDGICTLELPHHASLERPGGIINGPALMAAADCAMWLAIKARIGMEHDALTTDLNTAFLAPAKAQSVLCTARIVREGRRRIYGVAECHDQAGRIFTHHTITYSRLER